MLATTVSRMGGRWDLERPCASHIIRLCCCSQLWDEIVWDDEVLGILLVDGLKLQAQLHCESFDVVKLNQLRIPVMNARGDGHVPSIAEISELPLGNQELGASHTGWMIRCLRNGVRSNHADMSECYERDIPVGPNATVHDCIVSAAIDAIGVWFGSLEITAGGPHTMHSRRFEAIFELFNKLRSHRI